MRKQFLIFIIRWLFNSFGLWVAIKLFGTGYDGINITIDASGILFAGLVFSIVNSVLRPFFVIISIPAILLTLGLFIVIVNGFMVYISLKIAQGIQMTFINSVLTGIILSLVNYIVSATVVLGSKGGAIR